MSLPDNIRTLLLSKNNEDRTIGIVLLEKIPNYKEFFIPEHDKDEFPVLVLSNKQSEVPITIIQTKNNIYWINSSRAFIGALKGPAKGWFSNKTIKI